MSAKYFQFKNGGTVQELIDALAASNVTFPVVGKVGFLDFEGEGWTDEYPIKSGKITSHGIQLKGPSYRYGDNKQRSYKEWFASEAIKVGNLLEILKGIEDKSLPVLVKNVSYKKYEPIYTATAQSNGIFGPWFCIEGNNFHQER